MTNPHPDIFTDAEAEALLSSTKQIKAHMELDLIATQVRAWFKGCAPGNWLGLGLEIATDDTIGITGPTKSREQLRELVEERIYEDVEYGYGSWDVNTSAIANAWLDLSLYKLWTLIDNARHAGLSEFEDQFLAMAAGDDNGSSIGSLIQEAYADGVREWRETQRAEEAA
jgi:hypothetical protein